MRRPFIAGNWKMNLNRTEARDLAGGLAQRLPEDTAAEVAVCPPFVYLDAVGQSLQPSAVQLGAQDMYYEPQGAYTGEISGAMLIDLGCRWVILGHSERRHVLGETDPVVHRKALAALGLAIQPIVCVGETLQQREAGQTKSVIQQQFDGSLAGLNAEQMQRTVIAYEPVWAIGTGHVATPQQAEQVHADLREMLQSRYNAELASSVRILYGGSVKPENARDLLHQENIDGALVGGASLRASSFLGIIEHAGQ